MTTEKNVNINNSLDLILIRLNDFGKYQIYVFSLICITIVMHSMAHIAYVFTAMDLDYRCKIPECDLNNAELLYTTPWLNKTIPFKKIDNPEKCFRYENLLGNNTDDDHQQLIGNNNCSSQDFSKNDVEKCDKFVYKTVERSILQEYNLHCKENLWKLTLVGTINNAGQFFGLLISGLLSDKYGRKFILVWGIFVCALCGTMKAFMPTYELFLLFEFLDAAFGSGTYICGYVLGVELVGPSRRVLTGTIISSCYAIGEIFLAAAAWITQSWKFLTLSIYVPSLFFITYFWLIPESIRWNLSKNRTEEAKKTLKKLAKINGKIITDKELEVLNNSAVIVEKFDLSSGNVEKSSSNNNNNNLKGALKSGVLMLRLVTCCFCWITCTFLFYGLTLNSVSLVAGNKYLDFILTALVEVPAYFFCNLIVEKFGRKKSLCLSYFLTGAACLAFIFVTSTSRWGSLTVYLIGKFGATTSFTILYLLTSEMFPTKLRHSFMGTCSTFGRCGSMISPQTPLLAQYWEPLPLICFSTMSVLAGLLTLVFPETLHKKLPDTIDEAENIRNAPLIIMEKTSLNNA